MKTVILKNIEQMYEVVKTEEVLYITVVCGGIAMYERTIKLDAIETDRFLAEGEDFATLLASQVAVDDNRFRSRFLTNKF